MDEQNKPIDAEIVPNTPPPFAESEKKEDQPKTKLDSLPPEILAEVDKRILAGEALDPLRKELIAKYPNVSELKVNYPSWRKRALKLRGPSHKDSKEGEKLVKKEIGEALPTTQDIQTAVTKVIDPSVALQDKQAILGALYAKQMQRLTILEGKQQNYLNEDYEALIVAYSREIRATLETVDKLQDTLNNDITTQFRRDLIEYTRVLLNNVYNAYKLVHPTTDPNSKFDAFRIELETLQQDTVSNYSKLQNTSKN